MKRKIIIDDIPLNHKAMGGVLDNRLDGMKFNANTNYVNDVMNSQYANGGNINLPDGEYDLHPAHIDQLKRNGYKIEYI